MAKYKMDQQDILFNLLDVLNITQFEKYGLDSSAVKEILIECDKWVENEVYPTRQISDEQGITKGEKGMKVPECLHKVNQGYYEMGWYALGISEDIGGTPVPEALSAACRSLALGANTAWSMYPGLTKGAMNVMHKVGNDYVKSTYIPKIMEGKWGGTMCLTEAGAGSDVGNLKTTAKPIDGKDGWYKIKGTKIFISSGENDLYENIIHLVLARTPEGVEGTKGISLFVVPRFKVNDDGSVGESNDVTCPQVEHKMGIHASATSVLNFGDDDNCEGYLLGEEFDGMKNMFIMMNEARLDCGMQGEAQANLAYELTKQYVSERTQFKTEIINHPGMKKMMLKMRAMSRGLRSLILYTANLFDKAEEDKELARIVDFLTPICKSFCSEQGFNISVDAVQAHGGYGFCTEYGIEQFVRDTKIATIYEGTNEIQAIDFVTRKILKDEGKALKMISDEMIKSTQSLGDEFSKEKEILNKAFTASQKAIEYITKFAQEKKNAYVMQSCKELLDLSSYLIVGWRLLESAKVAHDKLSDATGEDKEFLQTKVVDFKIFCTQYLGNVMALSKAITTVEDDITQYNL